ncbi:potassium channel subfamily K member 18-like [Patiria miniata]|uniref:Potassium channel domain-containing protein n=1 Tax=Patiria miniata TaxID=46514 RepID=A0A914B5X2_PATMI|nr:potassium channel subfamily K member 18-like [Patiria miniata]
MLRGIRRTVSSRSGDTMSSHAAVCEDTVAGSCCSPRLVRWLRGSLPVLLWTGYLLVGAAIFQAVEYPEAERQREIQANLTKTTNSTIVRLFTELLDNMNETMNDTKQNKILTELAINLKTMSDETVNITRYGFLAPNTQLGRGLCIIYALIGIPLNIIVMASAGRALARYTRSVNRSLRQTWTRCAFWKKRVGPKMESSAPPRTRSKGEGTNDQRRRTHLRTLSLNREEFSDWSNRTSGEQTTTERDGDDDDRGLGVTGSPEPWNGDAPMDAISDTSSPAWLFLFLVLLYTCFFSAVMVITQPGWTVLDGFYYIIITITTIGFGDLQTSSNSDENTSLAYYLFGCLAIVIPVLGMILLSAGISIVVNQFGKKTKAIEEVVCGSSKTRG